MNASKVLWSREAARYVGERDSVFAFPGAALELFDKTGGLKVFHAVDAHPAAHNASLAAANADKAEFYPRWLERRIAKELQLADVILVPSMRTATQMIANGVDASRVRVLPYGAETGLFRPQELPNVADRPVVLYVGQFSSRKGVASLIEAAADSPVELWLVGNPFTPSLRSISPPSNIRVIEPLGHADLARLYNSADAFAIPTAEDACSLVALEAAAAGLPVYSTIHNGATEILPKQERLSLGSGSVSEIRLRLASVPKLSFAERSKNTRAAEHSGLRDWSEYAQAALREISLG
ncbi:glycosyltransferase family 4 protein [Microbacterium sp. BH-3-3-3]|uniref:glycosyltransferase family 4 protein n=1 Tax=Microbacterium sp. BH-3-3-3 TaxID=1906742 RepID=UPI001642E998|nr:glycosyltransferase family 4 protein [Microbacterium sp. BH-3-3-3]